MFIKEIFQHLNNIISFPQKYSRFFSDKNLNYIFSGNIKKPVSYLKQESSRPP